MRKRNFGFIGFLVVLSVMLVTPMAFADTVSGTGSWQTGVAPNEAIPPYWDHTSSDGSNQNVGYHLPGTLNYWGLAGGLADPNFYITHTGPANDAVLKVVVTSYDGRDPSDVDVFGWYQTGSTTLHPLLLASSAIGTSASFSPIGDYGFYLKSGAESPLTFLTQSSATGNSDSGNQHFAIFQGTDSSFWIGAEDLKFSAPSDKDYNDMIVKVSYTVTSVPEPTTLLLLGLGLVGLAGVRRKFQK